MTGPTEPLVSLEELLLIHTAMVDSYGGGVGVRDHGLIESALHRPVTSFGGQMMFPTPFLRAATLWWGLIKNHGFVDANKRTSSVAALRWLDREGYALQVSDDDLVRTALAVANGEHSVESLAGWIAGRAESLARTPPSPSRRPPQRRRSRARRPAQRGRERD
ncbi:MAG: type II toxin-antitoxin system death-on-curing family toxin [Candidatus Dormibacteraeota bacterium]|nr:type II toxin-antitoxin system death-on-curing family toxin [Candidatus Dormibacteraeota bacterium]MBO0762539.1 type II toxin-antitoxin system death-on-curing family toxin [Candidatus Dormibacteraeota bacterium]